MFFCFRRTLINDHVNFSQVFCPTRKIILISEISPTSSKKAAFSYTGNKEPLFVKPKFPPLFLDPGSCEYFSAATSKDKEPVKTLSLIFFKNKNKESFVFLLTVTLFSKIEKLNLFVVYPSGSDASDPNQWIAFTGSANVVTGEDNLITGEYNVLE